MIVVILLAANSRHADHVKRTMFFDPKKVRVFCPQREAELLGLAPDLIIESPEWWIGKCEGFHQRVEFYKKAMQVR